MHPKGMLACNLSPSFSWDVAWMNDEQMQSCIPELARMGSAGCSSRWRDSHSPSLECLFVKSKLAMYLRKVSSMDYIIFHMQYSSNSFSSSVNLFCPVVSSDGVQQCFK